MDYSGISEQLSDIPMWAIMLFTAAITVVRVGLVRTRLAPALVETIDAILIAVVLVFMIIQPFVMKAFFIPSGSMRETLLENDHIFCNKFDYRIRSPHHGDIVIFVAPNAALLQSPEGFHPGSGPVYYIKRLVGLPGDVIQTKLGYITVNGRQLMHEDIREALGLTDPDAEHVKIEANDVDIFNGTWKRYDAAELAAEWSAPGAPVTFHPGETIRNGKVLSEPYTAEDPAYDFKLVDGKSVLWQQYAGSPPEIQVDEQIPSAAEAQADLAAPPSPTPPGDLIVMGDNRNDSGDSTHWGPLAEHRLAGNAVAIFWPISRIRALH